jgi:DNA-binding transcriptional ArsR family regulator
MHPKHPKMKSGVRLGKELLDPERIKEDNIDYSALKMASEILKAVNHPLRQKVLNMMDSNGPMNVTEVLIKLRVEQSVASQHLGILRDAGFVKTFKNGKYVYYEVNYERIKKLTNSIADYITN